MTRDVIDALPTSRNYSSFGYLLPGVNTSARDVGGAGGDTMSQLTIHGSRPGDQRVMQNGVNTMTLQVNGDRGIAVPNPGMASEVTIDTSGLSAEQGQGGIRINYIPRDGGNTFSGTTVPDVREQRHAERQPHGRPAGARVALAQRHQVHLGRQSRAWRSHQAGSHVVLLSPAASTAPTSFPAARSST